MATVSVPLPAGAAPFTAERRRRRRPGVAVEPLAVIAYIAWTLPRATSHGSTVAAAVCEAAFAGPSSVRCGAAASARGRRRRQRVRSEPTFVPTLTMSPTPDYHHFFRQEHLLAAAATDVDGENDIESEYKFWDEPALTVSHFNMDLANIAADDPLRAQTALEAMEDLCLRERKRWKRRQLRRRRRRGLNNSTEEDGDDDGCDDAAAGENHEYVLPNAASYATVLGGWLSHASTSRRNRQMEALLDRLERRSAEEEKEEEERSEEEGAAGQRPLRPNAVAYMLVCQAWGDVQEGANEDELKAGAEAAEAVLERMAKAASEAQAKGHEASPPWPDVRMYGCVLRAWSRRAGEVKGAARRAENLLERMEQAAGGDEEEEEEKSARGRSFSRPAVPPNVICYSTVISALARSGDDDACHRAEVVTRRMERRGVQADAVFYTSLMNCYAKCRGRQRSVAADRASALLHRMEELHQSGENVAARPNPVTYATHVYAIANGMGFGDGDRGVKTDGSSPWASAATVADAAEAALRHMEREGVRPTTLVYNAVIDVLGRTARPASARRAENLLNEMLDRSSTSGEGGDSAAASSARPDARTWAGVMLTHVRASSSPHVDAASSVHRLLSRMKQVSESGGRGPRPNVVCYTICMSAWARCGTLNAASKAEFILKQMEDVYDGTGDVRLRPNALSYATVVAAYGKSGSAVRAEAVFDRMERRHRTGRGTHPNTAVFNALIDAWSRSPEEGAPLRAESVLKRMEAACQDGNDDARPDIRSMNTVLNAWAKCEGQSVAAQRAQQILEHMEQLHQKGQGSPPDVVSYNTVMAAWARCGDKAAVHNAERILNRLEALYQAGDESLMPNVLSYTTCINAAAYCNGTVEERAQAFTVATKAFTKICRADNTEHPNAITYGTFIKAISNLTPMDKSRDKMLEATFRRCQKDGEVDGFVLSQLRAACTTEAYDRLSASTFHRRRAF